MSQEDTMKLVAEIVDKYSGPLKEMQRALKETAAATKGIHVTGAAQAREHTKALREMHERIEKTRATVSGAFTPAMAALGLTTFGVGEALGAVVEKLKAMGAQYNIMNDASRRAGLSVDQIRQISVAFERLGISQDVAVKSSAEFGEHMDKLKRNDPEELASWTTKLAGAYQALGDQLRNIPTRSGQLDAVFDFFSSHPNIPVDQKRKFYEEILHLPPELATKTGEELKAALQKAAKYVTDHPDNANIGRELNDAFSELRETLNGINDDMVTAFGGSGAGLIKDLSKTLHQDMEDLKAFSALLDKIAKFLHIGSGTGTGDPMGEAVTKLRHSLDGVGTDTYGGSDSSGTWSPAQRLGAGIQPVSFNSGGSDAEDMLAKGVKTGMLAAFREWFSQSPSAGAAGGGSGGGLTNASYTPESSAPDSSPIGQAMRDAVSGRSGGGGGGGGGGAGHDSTKALVDKITGSKDKADNNDASLNPEGLSGSAFLQKQRSRFADELKANPGLRKQLAGMATTEGNPANVVEALMNRMAYTHGTIAKGLHSGFYGPINRGQLPGAMAALDRDPKKFAKVNAAIDSVLAGRNVLKGATDQGMTSDPNGRWLGGRVYGQDQVYNDWGGGPGGHEGARRFREDQQREVAAGGIRRQGGDDQDARNTFGDETPNKLLGQHRALMRDHIRGQGTKNQVEGNASLKIDLNGFPRGTKTAMNYGGLFGKATLNRGHQMETASETS